MAGFGVPTSLCRQANTGTAGVSSLAEPVPGGVVSRALRPTVGSDAMPKQRNDEFDGSIEIC
jgi:hypothetical protein